MANHDYSEYKELLEKYRSTGYENIERSDPFIVDLERKLDHGKQFFILFDLIRFKILFISKGIYKILGVDPDHYDFSTFFSKVYPDDLERFSLARTKFVKTSHDLLIDQKGYKLLSANFRMICTDDDYINLLFQAYLFYSEIPKRSVYAFLLMTDISSLEKRKHAYHYYVGNDMSNFRYPDAKLLETGRSFSQREFDVLKLIAEGMDSEQIAKKLFLSVNTVNTHRRNLLKKSNRASTHELVIELMETGVL